MLENCLRLRRRSTRVLFLRVPVMIVDSTGGLFYRLCDQRSRGELWGFDVGDGIWRGGLKVKAAENPKKLRSWQSHWWRGSCRSIVRLGVADAANVVGRCC